MLLTVQFHGSDMIETEGSSEQVYWTFLCSSNIQIILRNNIMSEHSRVFYKLSTIQNANIPNLVLGTGPMKSATLKCNIITST